MHGEDSYWCWVGTDPEDQNCCERQMFVKSEVLTVVSVQITAFLAVTPCTVSHYSMSLKTCILCHGVSLIVPVKLSCVHDVNILHSLPMYSCL
jgi:hypothetical protein